ncbi:hypothetical protein [Streptomyces sp. B1I3]|uniref:hypothetical protein n=1 Tax=Streptomyces sp. B1I3 TaxID=3042264 RepID=UPI002783C735|nr:hypothetical protein [Streptomyces sp. B1I3]MDQ0795716.1 hypothetical protein [Streptomyces sp. B1I3]
MRNPVGPLPSSIYWRRRAVAVLVVALLVALGVWAVTSGGGGGRKDDAKPGDSAPAPSITPGPAGSGPVVGQPPGGRDESGGSGGGGAGTGGGSGGDGATGAGGEAGSGTTGTGGSTSAGAGSGSGSGSGSGGSATVGVQVPSGSALPNCVSSALQLSLETENSYGPDDSPAFRLIARNTSATDCKADFGPKNVVLAITEAGEEDEQVWSSKDCPTVGALFLKVPAGATIVHTVKWDRRTSSPRCATQAAGKAAPGTYLLEAKAPGEPLQRASFVLAKD